MIPGMVVVIGDVLLDVDVEGTVERLCPDAPAPVLDVTAERPRPGGAGLAARLLAGSGAAVTLVTALGDDADAGRLRALLVPGVELVAGPVDGATAVKTRMLACGRPLLRADRGDGRPGRGFGAAVTPGLERALATASAVLVSDYGRGVAADPRVRAAVAMAASRGVPVVWDPHPRGAAPVPGTTVATPNRAEAGVSPDTVPAAFAAADRLLQRWDCRAVAVTLGARGAVVAHRHGAHSAAPAVREVSGDPCGAGDAFAGRLTALLGRRSGIDEAVQGAVAAAGEFVARGGAAGLGSAPSALPGSTGLAAARALAAGVTRDGGTVVASGGCFDLLHTGHSRTLAAARALGDCLIVLLNSDASVRGLKGPGRPIVPAEERAEMLMALGCVDAVVVFDDDNPCAMLERLRPHLWVKGGDYDPADLPETALLRSWGGEVTTVAYRPGRSTSRLVAAMAPATGKVTT